MLTKGEKVALLGGSGLAAGTLLYLYYHKVNSAQTSQTAQLKAQIASLEAQISSAKAAASSASNAANSAAQAQINTLTSALTQLKSQLSAVQAQEATATKQESALTSANTLTQAQVAALQAQLQGQTVASNANQLIPGTQQTLDSSGGADRPLLSGIPSSLYNLAQTAQNEAYLNNGQAESSTAAVQQDLYIAARDAVPVANTGIYGNVPNDTTELSSQGGKSYYITDINGQYYKSQVPVAIAPSYGGGGVVNPVSTTTSSTTTYHPSTTTSSTTSGGHYITKQVQTGTHQVCTTQRVATNHATYYATYYPWNWNNGHPIAAHYGPPGRYGAPYWNTYTNKQVCQEEPTYTTQQVWVQD